jgi:lipopolysaccharide/colanic/teichoic acid biosynthesis glycosyltransferase
MAAVNPAPVAAPERAPAPRARPYPRWARPERLRQERARRGWRCQLSPSERRLKRSLDLALLALAGPPAALLIALAALAVWLETPGSPFFAQPRLGAHGRRFRMWKLRTMVANAAALEKDLAHLNELPWPDFKIRRDPRITRVGRLLRRTSLDELPQLWNVLRGEMSWVGPRPTNFGLERYALWHTERLAMPPGLTGLWQVLERAQCDFDRRLRLDLAYVRGWRLRLDVAILWATLAVVVSGRGAY